MEIRRWENWYTYSSFYQAPDLDLHAVAKTLVQEGLADFASHREGLTVWQQPTGMAQGNLRVDVTAAMDQGRLELIPEDDSANLSAYQRDCLGLTGQFRYGEARLFGLEREFPRDYIRCFLGKFRLSSQTDGSGLNIYPILVLYEIGVAVLHLRVFSPEEPTLHEWLAERFVNLPRLSFETLAGPPAYGPGGRIARLDLPGLSWTQRLGSVLPTVRRIALSEGVGVENEEEFSFPLAPILQPEEHAVTTREVAEVIMDAVGHALLGPRRGWQFLLRGSKGRAAWGGYWRGRPNVHVVEFEGQRELASEQVEAFRRVWTAILLGSATPPDQTSRHVQLHDLRLFDDYSAFVTIGGSLWVWAKLGLHRHEASSLPSGSIAVEPQVAVEAIEYGYMLHRLLLDVADSETISARTAIDLQAGALRLRSQLANAASSGEIRELLLHAWEEMGLSDIKEELVTAIQLRRERLALDDHEARESANRRLTVLFGVLAVPPIAELVLAPLWTLLELPRPLSEAAHQLVLVSVAVAVVAALVAVLLKENTTR